MLHRDSGLNVASKLAVVDQSALAPLSQEEGELN